MANRTIVIEMSPSSIRKSVKMLEAYQRFVDKKIEELMVRLAAIGLSTARVYFQAGATDGNEAPRTYVKPIESGFKIVAEGGDVYIIEFGAGDAAGKHPAAGNVSIDTSPGSLSRKNTGEYATYGSWHYQKQKYTEIQPQMPMYRAAREIERNIEKIAKEVFG